MTSVLPVDRSAPTFTLDVLMPRSSFPWLKRLAAPDVLDLTGIALIALPAAVGVWCLMSDVLAGGVGP
jgi:hypothetical protein